MSTFPTAISSQHRSGVSFRSVWYPVERVVALMFCRTALGSAADSVGSIYSHWLTVVSWWWWKFHFLPPFSWQGGSYGLDLNSGQKYVVKANGGLWLFANCEPFWTQTNISYSIVLISRQRWLTAEPQEKTWDVQIYSALRRKYQ